MNLIIKLLLCSIFIVCINSVPIYKKNILNTKANQQVKIAPIHTIETVLINQSNNVKKSPRIFNCGTLDKIKNIRHKRFSIYNMKWPTTNITWGLSHKYLNTTTYEKARIIINNSMDTWSIYTPLLFREISYENANIKISFLNKHYDAEYNRNFGGPLNALGTGFYPNAQNTKSGNIYLDLDEDWNFDEFIYEKADFKYVITHEIGHALGLEHSDEKNAVMYYYFDVNIIMNNNNYNYISKDDILGIQSLYGVNPLYKLDNMYDAMSTTTDIISNNHNSSVNKKQKQHDIINKNNKSSFPIMYINGDVFIFNDGESLKLNNSKWDIFNDKDSKSWKLLTHEMINKESTKKITKKSKKNLHKFN